MYAAALGLLTGAANALNSQANGSGNTRRSGTSNDFEQVFNRLDTNQDGRVSQAEFLAAGQNMPTGQAEATETPNGADRNAWSASRRNLFKAMDTDGDGSISKQEAAAFNAQKTAARAALLSVQEQFGNGQHAAGGQHGQRSGQRRV